MTELLTDPSMRPAIEAARRTAKDGGPVLILGEVGTGRKLLAQFIHERGAVATPLAVVRCDATDPLSGLSTLGKGSVFLADIGCLDAVQQVALVEWIRSGASPRVIASATPVAVNTPHNGGIAAHLYRLFERRVVTVPSLRDRPAAIPGLLRRFLGSTVRGERASLRVAETAMSHLLTYDWPGNVDELEQLALRLRERVVGEIVTADDLPPQIRWFPGRRAAYGVDAAGELGSSPFADEFQFRLIADALRRTCQR